MFNAKNYPVQPTVFNDIMGSQKKAWLINIFFSYPDEVFCENWLLEVGKEYGFSEHMSNITKVITEFVDKKILIMTARPAGLDAMTGKNWLKANVNLIFFQQIRTMVLTIQYKKFKNDIHKKMTAKK